MKTLKKYQNNFNKNNIKIYEIVATSAFRDTQNSEDARRYVENKIEHPIRIISGLEEAKLISLHPKAQSKNKNVFVDVGGGSTEIYMHQDDKDTIQSFQLGAVRGMLNKNDHNEWKRLKNWLKKQKEVEILIGLGGNIRSFLKIYESNKMSTNDLIQFADELRMLGLAEKIQKYNLDDDRADVIDEALKIYIKIAKLLKVKTIKSTKWGVSDSIAVKTFHELYSDKITISRS